MLSPVALLLRCESMQLQGSTFLWVLGQGKQAHTLLAYVVKQEGECLPLRQPILALTMVVQEQGAKKHNQAAVGWSKAPWHTQSACTCVRHINGKSWYTNCCNSSLKRMRWALSYKRVPTTIANSWVGCRSSKNIFKPTKDAIPAWS